MPATIAPPPAPTKPSTPPAPTLAKATPAPKPPEKPLENSKPDTNGEGFHDVLGNDFDELQELDGKPEKSKRGEKKEAVKPEPTEKAKTNGEPKQDDKPATPEPKTPPELREAYQSLKDKVSKEYEPQIKELATLRSKVKEFESRDESTTKATQDEIASVKKRNAELEQAMRFVDYEKSREYQDQFQKPYEEAWGNALRELKGLTMKIEDPKSGEEIVREVTQADIAYFANLDPAARRTEINRLFPEDKEEVKRHINQISHLADKSFQAREKAKAESENHSKAETESQRQSQAQRAKLWKQTNEALATKYPKWFGKDEADPEGNAIFDRGTALADLLLSPQDLTPERVDLLPKLFKESIQSSKPFSQEALVKLHAIARNKIANHDRAVSKLKAATERIAALEKTVKDYEDSGPDKVSVGDRRPSGNGEMTDEQELLAIDRR